MESLEPGFGHAQILALIPAVFRKFYGLACTLKQKLDVYNKDRVADMN
jgi:hypothetical protein